MTFNGSTNMIRMHAHKSKSVNMILDKQFCGSLQAYEVDDNNTVNDAFTTTGTHTLHDDNNTVTDASTTTVTHTLHDAFTTTVTHTLHDDNNTVTDAFYYNCYTYIT